VAIELISEHGYHQTSIEDIAAGAGTTKTTFYAHFATKESILADVQQQMWDTIGATYRAFGDMDAWDRDSISTWLLRTIEVWRRSRLGFRACMSVQQSKIDAEHAGYHRRFVSLLMRNERLWSRFPPETAQARASLLLRMTEAYLTSWLLREWAVDPDASVEAMLEVWLDVLHAAT
jgi:AcrR family transcriptional regulator